ncbi:hypothetical protein [Herbidospora sp. RD11066]
MRRIFIPGLVAAVAVTGLSAPANAHPSSDPVLAENALYSTGPIPRAKCAEKPIRRKNHFPTAKAYVEVVAGCLDRVWAKQLGKAKFRFKKPKFRLLAKNPIWDCDLKWEKQWSYGYCADNRTITIVLDKRLTGRTPGDLSLFTLVATLYSEHVQYLAGIEKAWVRALPDSEDLGAEETEDEIIRRLYQQSLCFAAAFTGSVYASMPRKSADWKAAVAKRSKERHWGSPEDTTYWMNGGFTTRDLADCNTWRAENSLVD